MGKNHLTKPCKDSHDPDVADRGVVLHNSCKRLHNFTCRTHQCIKCPSSRELMWHHYFARQKLGACGEEFISDVCFKLGGPKVP